MNNTKIYPSDLDFDTIRSNLKSHFAGNPKYADWNFDGSGLSVLLDILSYNTHQNAINAHFALNEAFLSSAQLRSNVVSHAKTLGYTPKSVSGSVLTIDLISSIPASNYSAPPSISRGTIFETERTNNGSFQFINIDDRIASIESIDLGHGENNYYVIRNVVLKEGKRKTFKYTIDGSLSNQRFTIPHDNVDLSTLRVKVTPPGQIGSAEFYTQHSNLLSQHAESPVFFVQESYNQFYEIYFGDGYIGKLPTNGSTVELDYIISQGSNGNGVTALENNNNIFEGGQYIINYKEGRSSGGNEKESMESVRLNAPLAYVSQNRAITADDYKVLITQASPLIDNYNQIAVWGGENEGKYGRVYIAIKPNGAESLTETQKNYIIDSIRKKNVITIEPKIVDPKIVKIFMNVKIFLNTRNTHLSSGELITLVQNTISNYNQSSLNSFESAFRYSQFLNQIDSADPGIINSIIPKNELFMTSNHVITDSEKQSFEVTFPTPIQKFSDGQLIKTDTIGEYLGHDVYIADDIADPFNASAKRLYLYDARTKHKIRNSFNRIIQIGKVNSLTGTISIENLTLDVPYSSTIDFEVVSNEQNIYPKLNTILEIDTSKTRVEAVQDKITMEGLIRENNVQRVSPY